MICHRRRRLSAGPIRRCTSRSASARLAPLCAASSVVAFAVTGVCGGGFSGAGDNSASMSAERVPRSVVCNFSGTQLVHCGRMRKYTPGSLRRVNISPSATGRPQLAQRSGRNARYTASLEPSAPRVCPTISLISCLLVNLGFRYQLLPRVARNKHARHKSTSLPSMLCAVSDVWVACVMAGP